MRMTDHKLIAVAALAAMIATAVLLRFGAVEAPPSESPSSGPASETPPPVSAALPLVAPVPESGSPADHAGDEAVIAERLALVESDPVLMDRARQQELAPAADARWADAVDRAGYTRDDIDPAVRASLRLVEFEPRYAEDGMIDGLTIRSLPSGHPFEQAGFHAGDRLSRIEGVRLYDPSELPALFTRLGPRFEVCAWASDGGESCSEVVVD